MPNKPKQTVAQKDRARLAVDLKIAGATWPQIAEELNFKTEAGARLLVSRYFQDVAKTQFEEMHPVILERAEMLWRRAWSKLNSVQQNGSMDDWNRAMTQCVNVLQQLARISGLGNGPMIQVNVTTADDVRRLRDEFYEMRGLGIGNVVDAEVVAVEADSTANLTEDVIGLARQNSNGDGNGNASDEDND